MLRLSCVRKGAATSNIFAPPHTGRWFNPPHQWTWYDCLLPVFMVAGVPAMLVVGMYIQAYGVFYSHYQEKNYYDQQPYTKEFIHKYKRLERWRHY